MGNKSMVARFAEGNSYKKNSMGVVFESTQLLFPVIVITQTKPTYVSIKLIRSVPKENLFY